MRRCRIPLATLLDAREGRLDPAAAARLDAHRAGGCDHCERRLAQLATLAADLRADALPDAPERALAAARQIFRDFRPAAPARIPFLARLVFDSRAAAPAFARRVGGDAVTRLFETDAHVVDLWEEDGTLMGQAFTLPERGALRPERALLVGDRAHTATLDGDAFVFVAVPAGRYTLQLEIGDALVRLPDLVVGAEDG